MENSGESGEDSGSLSTTAFLAGGNCTSSYVMQADDMEGWLFCLILLKFTNYKIPFIKFTVTI